jgi:hypothetical protein
LSRFDRPFAVPSIAAESYKNVLKPTTTAIRQQVSQIHTIATHPPCNMSL